jgi:hypothetical protein
VTTDTNAVYHMKAHIQSGKESQSSVVNYRKDGTGFVNLVTIIPICWESDEVAYYVGFQIDVVNQPNNILERMKDGTYTVNYSLVQTDRSYADHVAGEPKTTEQPVSGPPDDLNAMFRTAADNGSMPAPPAQPPPQQPHLKSRPPAATAPLDRSEQQLSRLSITPAEQAAPTSAYPFPGLGGGNNGAPISRNQLAGAAPAVAEVLDDLAKDPRATAVDANATDLRTALWHQQLIEQVRHLVRGSQRARAGCLSTVRRLCPRHQHEGRHPLRLAFGDHSARIRPRRAHRQELVRALPPRRPDRPHARTQGGLVGDDGRQSTDQLAVPHQAAAVRPRLDRSPG